MYIAARKQAGQIEGICRCEGEASEDDLDHEKEEQERQDIREGV